MVKPAACLVALTWQRTKMIRYLIRTLTNMSGSYSCYSDMQLWWYSFWIRFETYFTNTILIIGANCVPGVSIISSLKFWLLCIVTLTANTRAESVMIRQKATLHNVYLVVRQVKVLKMVAAHYIFPRCVYLQFLYRWWPNSLTITKAHTPPHPTPQHAAASGVKDRCCRKPRNPFRQ